MDDKYTEVNVSQWNKNKREIFCEKSLYLESSITSTIGLSSQRRDYRDAVSAMDSVPLHVECFMAFHTNPWEADANVISRKNFMKQFRLTVYLSKWSHCGH